MIIKLDMVNTFDKVKHAFLYLVMRTFGFSKDFVYWIQSCIGSPWIYPLLNGIPNQFFQSNGGLRKGFPISPSLYIIMKKTLSRKLEEDRRTG